MTESTGLRSGDVARAAGVSQQTLRYYERRGLLAEPIRTPGGHRVNPADTVTLLRAIKGAQRLGFTLDEVADLLDVGGRRRARGRAGVFGTGEDQAGRGGVEDRGPSGDPHSAAGCDRRRL
jgi:DNA-binding transcriptional MerR regulator